MFLLLPVARPDRGFPPVTTLLVGFCVLAFLITWPMQQSHESTVSREHYNEQAQKLVSLLLDPTTDLPAEERQLLENEKSKEPFPSAAVLALFQRVQSNPLVLSSSARYRWSLAYPVFESQSRSHVKDPEATTVFETFGYKPDHAWWPGILTHQFLHAGWLHIFFNMLFLWAAGNVLEGVIGLWMLALYLLCGVMAAVCQSLWGIPSGQVMVGASGAIAGLMGFSLLALPSHRIRLLYIYALALMPRFGTFECPLWACVPLWILQQMFMLMMPLTGELANVGYAAHVGGFFFGALLGLLYRIFGNPMTPDFRIA